MLSSEFNSEVTDKYQPMAPPPAPFGLMMSDLTREQFSDKLTKDLTEFARGYGIIILNTAEISTSLRQEIEKLAETEGTASSGLNRKITMEAYAQIRAVLPDQIEQPVLDAISMQLGELSEFAGPLVRGEDSSRPLYDTDGKYSFGIVSTSLEDYKKFMSLTSGLPEENFSKDNDRYLPQAIQYLKALHEIGHLKFLAQYPEGYQQSFKGTLNATIKEGDPLVSHSLFGEISADREALGHFLKQSDILGIPTDLAQKFEQARALATFNKNINYTDYFAYQSLGQIPILPDHDTSVAFDIKGKKIVDDSVSLDLQKSVDSILTGNQLADSLIGKQYFEAYKNYEAQFTSEVNQDSAVEEADISLEQMIEKYGPLADSFGEFALVNYPDKFNPLTDFDYAALGGTIARLHPDVKYGAIKKLDQDGVVEKYSQSLNQPQLKEYVGEYLAASQILAPDMVQSPLSAEMQSSEQSLPGPEALKAYLKNNNLGPDCTVDYAITCPEPAPVL